MKCLVIDKTLLQTVNNHPVHILNNNGDFSPSSFIPFCAFGEEFIGTEINEFDAPVCNDFKPKNYLDQLCYELDLQKLKDRNSEKLKQQLELGLTLVLDVNEERQMKQFEISKNKSYVKKSIYHNDDNSASVYLDTISINQFYSIKVKLFS